LLDKDEKFKKYIETQSFKPFITNNSNMLYVKGLIKPGEATDPELNEELKAFFEKLDPNWKVQSVFTKANERGAWGYVCFSTPEECKQAFEKLKPLKTTFRGNILFANIKNQADNRAVIIYDLRDDVTEEQVNNFFKTISENSKKVEVARREDEP
jgi:RNA recognition motif-containing protein